MPADQVEQTGQFLTCVQVATIAEHIAKTEPICGLQVRFAAGTGIRRSEITGLRIQEMELDLKP